MIQHTEEQDEIEDANRLRREIEHLDLAIFDLRAEDPPSALEARLGPPPLTIPAKGVDGQDA